MQNMQRVPAPRVVSVWTSQLVGKKCWDHDGYCGYSWSITHTGCPWDYPILRQIHMRWKCHQLRIDTIGVAPNCELDARSIHVWMDCRHKLLFQPSIRSVFFVDVRVKRTQLVLVWSILSNEALSGFDPVFFAWFYIDPFLMDCNLTCIWKMICIVQMFMVYKL